MIGRWGTGENCGQRSTTGEEEAYAYRRHCKRYRNFCKRYRIFCNAYSGGDRKGAVFPYFFIIDKVVSEIARLKGMIAAQQREIEALRARLAMAERRGETGKPGKAPAHR